jgi:PAS domain S-box-containing protein
MPRVSSRLPSFQPPDNPNQQLGGILERFSDALVALDKNWRYTYVNQRAADLFGRRPEDLIGKYIWAEFPEGKGQPFHLAYEKAMSEQVFVEMESYYEPWQRWFENRIYPSNDGLSIFFHEVTERKRAEQSAYDSTRLLKGQNEVLELIARGAPLHDTLDLLLHVIESQSPGMLCSILLLDLDNEHLRHGAAPSLPKSYTHTINGARIGPNAGSCGTAAFTGETVIVEDIATHPLWQDYRDAALEHGLRACWSTPIFDAQHRVLGTFALYFRSVTRPDQRHRGLIDLATQTAAIAIVKNRETEALRASEEWLRLAVSGGNVGIWEWILHNNRLVWNAELKAIFGWPAEADDLTLERFLDAVHVEDRERVEAALQHSLAEHADYDIEFRITLPNGSISWIAAKGRGEYDGAGNPVRMMGVVLDITDRKRADEEINRRQAQLAEAQRIAHLGSYEWDLRTNTVYRSEELCAIFGLNPAEFPPTFEAYLDRVHAEDRSTTRATIERAFREREPFIFEERIVHPDGTVRRLHSEGRWIFDAAGELLRLVGVCQDVTERKQADDNLRRSEERFQVAAKATNDAIWDWDLATDAVWSDESITTIFKYPAESVGADIHWFRNNIHPTDLERVTSAIRAVMDNGEQFWSGEYQFRRGDGSYANVFDRGYVLYGENGSPARMIGAMADISERVQAFEILEHRVASRTAELQEKNHQLEAEIAQRKRAEELLRTKNQELKGFAYTVSHDLKAPLRGIAGYAQELDRRHKAALSDRALFCLKQILIATNNLDRLIEDLLNYSRLDAEMPSYIDVDLRGLVENILADRRQVISDYGAEMVVNLLTPSLRTWERGLMQILTNLLDNALKYSRASTPPRLEITSRVLEGRHQITISDNGIGFDMKYHDRIFGLFNRLVRQEDFEGTGAGLAIVKKLVDKLGGRIRAEATPGLGATFFVELPVRPGSSDSRSSNHDKGSL